MKVEEVLKLIDAGYTREEIKAFEETPEVEVIEETPEPTPKAPEKAPDSISVMADIMENYMKSMQDTLKEIQKANIKNSQMPAQEENALDNALAAIITPTKKK